MIGTVELKALFRRVVAGALLVISSSATAAADDQRIAALDDSLVAAARLIETSEGDRRQELRQRRKAVDWSERTAKAYDRVLRDYDYGMAIDYWRAHHELANDRIDLARLRGDCCDAERARSELLRSATELYDYVRTSKPRIDDAYELEYAHCAQTLAEIKCRLHQNIQLK